MGLLLPPPLLLLLENACWLCLPVCLAGWMDLVSLSLHKAA